MTYRDDAKAFVDGELDELRSQAVEGAMKTDSDLREEIDAMRALGFELKRIAVEHPSKGADKAMGAFRKRPWWLRPQFAFASVAGLVLVGFVVFPVFAQSKAGALRATRETLAADEDAPANGFVTLNGKVPAHRPNKPVTSPSGGESRFGGLVNPDTSIADPTLQAPKSDKGAGYVDAFNDTGDGSGADIGGPNDVLRPDLIRTATLALKVSSAKTSMENAMAIAKRMGGFYESSHHAKGEEHNASADVTLRVPVSRFDTALTALRALGEVIEDTSEFQDVTAQIADTGARLKVMKAEEESYVTMLRAGRRVGEILEIKDRLSTVRQEIESLTAQQKALKNQSSYSTIACTFEERPRVKEEEPAKGWTDDSWANAVNGLKGVGRFLGQVGINIFVYAPVWLPILFVGWFLLRRAKRP